jgi:hypothetical protein
LFDRREEEAESKDGIEAVLLAKKVKVESELKKDRVKTWARNLTFVPLTHPLPNKHTNIISPHPLF